MMEKNPPDAEPVFPAIFKYGVTRSAYQVEADIPPSNWSLWTTKDGSIFSPDERLKCDGYNRAISDAEIACKLGCKIYRFSISWSRINPSDGQFNREALLDYRNLCVYLKQNGMEPLVTLWYFEHPAWLENNGSIAGPNFVQKYGEFIEFVATGLSGVCSLYHTINDPIGYVVDSYLFGRNPPGKGSYDDALGALVNLFKCHAIGYQIIHRVCPEALVSYAQGMIPFVPKHKWSLFETLYAHILNKYNRIGFESISSGKISFLWKSVDVDGLKDSLDFISLNHFYPIFTTLNHREFSKNLLFLSRGERFLSISDQGWGLLPGSLAGVVKWANDTFNSRKIGIMISEHGLADRDDFRRQWYLKESLQHLSQLVSERIPIIGYMHCALTDQYEWNEGTSLRYGLYEVDYRTLERKPRKSADQYSYIIQSQKTRTSFF